MTGTTPRVIVIPPKPELARSKAVQRQLRVAAYCRVSTDDEEQLTSYEAQVQNLLRPFPQQHAVLRQRDPAVSTQK